MFWPKLLHILHQYRSLKAVKTSDVKYIQVVIINKANLIDGIRINGFI